MADSTPGPLAVVPELQRQGIGCRLVEHGVRLLKEPGIALVFVIGHPDYYRLQGFVPAGELGFDPPYAVREQDAGAWRVKQLASSVIRYAGGKVVCADSLDRPHSWRE